MTVRVSPGIIIQGSDAVPVGFPALESAFRLAAVEKRQCTVPGCITLLRADRPSGDETCSSCKHRPRCRVCNGRRASQHSDRHCYRCNGTGIRPVGALEVSVGS